MIRLGESVDLDRTVYIGVQSYAAASGLNAGEANALYEYITGRVEVSGRALEREHGMYKDKLARHAAKCKDALAKMLEWTGSVTVEDA